MRPNSGRLPRFVTGSSVLASNSRGSRRAAGEIAGMRIVGRLTKRGDGKCEQNAPAHNRSSNGKPKLNSSAPERINHRHRAKPLPRLKIFAQQPTAAGVFRGRDDERVPEIDLRRI